MQNTIPNPEPGRRFGRRLSTKARLSVLGLTLLVAAGVVAAALSRLLPDSPNRAQDVGDRLTWYVQKGQLQADLHTLAAAVDFLVTTDAETPVATTPTNLPVAGNFKPTHPQS